MESSQPPLSDAHLHNASELPWVDHEERGKWFVKIGDDFRWYLGPTGQVQAGAHWFDDRAAAEAAIAIYRSERRS